MTIHVQCPWFDSWQVFNVMPSTPDTHTRTHSVTALISPPLRLLSDLQEDGGVLLVQFHQLQVGYGVNHPHGFASNRHGNGQQYNVVT